MSYSSCKTLKKLKKDTTKIAKYENEITSANAIKNKNHLLHIVEGDFYFMMLAFLYLHHLHTR